MPRDAECSYGKDPWVVLIIPWLGFRGLHCRDQIITKCQGGVQECILALFNPRSPYGTKPGQVSYAGVSVGTNTQEVCLHFGDCCRRQFG
jgi:hypothetical protein